MRQCHQVRASCHVPTMFWSLENIFLRRVHWLLQSVRGSQSTQTLNNLDIKKAIDGQRHELSWGIKERGSSLGRELCWALYIYPYLVPFNDLKLRYYNPTLWMRKLSLRGADNYLYKVVYLWWGPCSRYFPYSDSSFHFIDMQTENQRCEFILFPPTHTVKCYSQH